MDREKFKHHTQLRVRNYEVDWQGIVHNANYLLYFEVGRLEYLKHIGVKVDIHSIQHGSRIVLARNEIDYETPAQFDDLLTIHTRISYLKNTSFGFEGFVENASTKKLVATNIAVHVWMDAKTGDPMPIPDEFRQIIRNFEGDDVGNILPPSYA